MIFTRGYGRCQRLCVYQSLACPRNNSGSVQARITKIEPKMQNTLVKVLIVFLWRGINRDFQGQI